MGTCGNFLLEGAVLRFLHDDLVRLGVSAARRRHCRIEIAFRPGGDDMSDIGSIARPPQKMIGTGKRDEALRVLGSGEYAAGIVDTDRFIGRRMKYQQRFVQVANAAGEVLCADVVEQITANAERAPGECDLDLALAL